MCGAETFESRLDLVDLNPGDPRLEQDALPVLKALRPQLTSESFAEIYSLGFDQGLRFSVVYLDGRCVGVCGWRVVHNTSSRRKLYIDDLVTAKGSRSSGIGSFVLAQMALRARHEGCLVLDLDSGVQREDAHRFYLREGLAKTALHFGREISH